jgi:hypothetical protein
MELPMTPAPTFKHLFLADHNQVPELAAAARAIGGPHWQGVYERALDVLDIAVIDVLLAAWRKHGEVRELLRATAADPTHTALVHLTEHAIESAHAPSIEVRSHGTPIARLSFAVSVACEIEAVELVIRAGAIDEVRLGEVRIQGTVKLDNSLLLARTLAPIALPQRIALSQRDEPALLQSVA